MKRSWIGIDITYQSISLILKRMEDMFGKDAVGRVRLSGIPQDLQSATALANKYDDRVRKEFEKWAVLTYSDNRAVINDKKGADGGVDGVIHFYTDFNVKSMDRAIVQVKSGHVGSKDIRDLRGTLEREKAALGILITLETPTGPMLQEAKAAGTYTNKLMNRAFDKLQIVTIKELIEQHKRFELRMGLSALKSAKKVQGGEQGKLI